MIQAECACGWTSPVYERNQEVLASLVEHQREHWTAEHACWASKIKYVTEVTH